MGICLGAQLMTRVLGGVVYTHPSEQVEIGWYPIDPVGPGKRILTPLTHVYQWHREGSELPSGASRLASGSLVVSSESKSISRGPERIGHSVSPRDATKNDEPLADAGRSHARTIRFDEYR